jgi:sugar-specific transcriptional regulator TrmB
MKNLVIDELLDKVARFSTLLGISRNELRVYAILLINGRLTAREIAEKINISYNKVYPILNKLELRGWIKKIGSKPSYYEPLPVWDVWSNIKKIIQEKIENFEKEFIEPLSTMLSSSSTYNILIIPANSLLQTLIQILASPSSRYLFAIAHQRLIIKENFDLINALVYKAEVRIITIKELEEHVRKYAKGCEVRVLESLFGSGLITNDSVLLVIKQYEDLIGIFSTHKYIVDIARVYFEYLWERASRVL